MTRTQPAAGPVWTSEEQRMLVRTTADFAAREIAPLVERADREDDGHLSVATFRALLRSAAQVGLPGLLLPEEHGGAGRSCLDSCLVQEELGAVDAGVASALSLTMSVPSMLLAAGTAEQLGRWLPRLVADEPLVLAGALNEPDVAGSDLFDPTGDERHGPRTHAVPDGDAVRLHGEKAGWVTNAGFAGAYLVFARTGERGPANRTTSAFWVEADAPGLTVGPRTSMLGLRSAFHAPLHLDGVRVEETDRIGRSGQGLMLMQTTTPGMAVGLAAVFVGLARAAYELALAWSQERRSWGQPIGAHQAVALRLTQMRLDLDATRLLVHEAARGVDTLDLDQLPVLVPGAKLRAVETAIANAQRCVQVLGATGVTRGGGAEKLLRDAWTGWSCDFTGDLLGLAVAQGLAPGAGPQAPAPVATAGLA